MPPKLKDITFNFIPVRTDVSLDKLEVRKRAIGLYRAWYRQLPMIIYDYNMPLTAEQGRSKLREIFVKNSRITDVRMINLLITRGQMELNESVNKQKEDCHLWKYFRAEQKKPETFLSKFLEGTRSIFDLRFDQQKIPQDEQEQLKSSSRVVWGAAILNGFNFVAKTVAWIYTGSHSMFAESIHSLADTANQLILAVGIRKSLQSPTADHPYGYHPMRYIAPLISGVGIFCVGCGLSVYHGIEALAVANPEIYSSPLWAYGILTFSLISESTTLAMAVLTLRSGALKSGLSIRDYIGKNSDPGVIVVLLEDVAAVLGIGIAATSMALSSHYGTHVFDACGSLLIGSLLGGVATFIIKKNTIALVGKSIPRETLNSINRIIEKDVLIRAIHDVKATDLGNGIVRYKAEVDVDGRELSRKYLERVDLQEILDEIKEIKCEKDVENFILVHGEGVVDMLGAEVDRIEKELRRNHPKVRHVDLEVL